MKKGSSAASKNNIDSKINEDNQLDFSEYAKQMRKDLSNKDIFTKEGDLNHAYFLTKRG